MMLTQLKHMPAAKELNLLLLDHPDGMAITLVVSQLAVEIRNEIHAEFHRKMREVEQSLNSRCTLNSRSVHANSDKGSSDVANP